MDVNKMQATVALLAPVPIEHLKSAVELLATENKVAFGSRAWQVFCELDESNKRQPCPALIYASDERHGLPYRVSWVGAYAGHVESKGGAHPFGMKYRPESTRDYPSDNKGHWAVFWELSSLDQIDSAEWMPIENLRSATTGKAFMKTFWPEGPTVILNPFTS